MPDNREMTDEEAGKLIASMARQSRRDAMADMAEVMRQAERRFAPQKESGK